MSTGDLLNIDPLELKFPCQYLLLFLFSSRISFLFFFLLFFGFSRFLVLFFFLAVVYGFQLFTFLVELKKQISCSLQLSNKTDNYVAFKVNFHLFFTAFACVCACVCLSLSCNAHIRVIISFLCAKLLPFSFQGFFRSSNYWIATDNVGRVDLNLEIQNVDLGFNFRHYSRSVLKEKLDLACFWW